MDHQYGFQTLDIYKLAKELVIDCHRVTRRFPDEEKYALVPQMKRAAVSVPSNIAEGYSREGTKEKAHFLNIAYGSLMELMCQFDIACDLGYMSAEQLNDLLTKSKRLSVKINNFRNHYLMRVSNDSTAMRDSRRA